MTNKINHNYAALINTGLAFRITTQRHGKARAYFDGDWCEFWSNNVNAERLTAQALHANKGSHLDRVMAELKQRNQAKLDHWAAARSAKAEAMIIGAAMADPISVEAKKSVCRI